MIWRHFGRVYIAGVLGLDEAKSAETIEQIHTELDAGLVRDIDAVDNGELAAVQDALMHPLSLANLFSMFRPAFDEDEPGIDDAAFAATDVIVAVFCHAGRFVAIARSRQGAMALLRKALES